MDEQSSTTTLLKGLDVETRLPPASSWKEGSTIDIDVDKKEITGYTQQGAKIGKIDPGSEMIEPIKFDSYMGPKEIKNCRKPSKFGFLKSSFDRKNRYDFIKKVGDEGARKVVLSINFNFPQPERQAKLVSMLNDAKVEEEECLEPEDAAAGGRKRKSRSVSTTRKAKKTGKRKKRVKKTRTKRKHVKKSRGKKHKRKTHRRKMSKRKGTGKRSYRKRR